jgi:hypothetical protein
VTQYEKQCPKKVEGINRKRQQRGVDLKDVQTMEEKLFNEK